MTKPARKKEQAILEAAEREFLDKGFAGARTTSIAKAAGVTHAMLHYYFRTKEQLFERILDEKTRLMSQSVLTAFGQPDLPLRNASGTASRATSTLSRRIPTCRASSSTRSFRVPSVTKRCAAASGSSPKG